MTLFPPGQNCNSPGFSCDWCLLLSPSQDWLRPSWQDIITKISSSLSNVSHCSGSSLPTTGQVLATDKRFSTLLLALEIAFGNETSLDPPFTVFAPTAQAFNKLDNSTLSNLLQNPDDLAQGFIIKVGSC